VGAEFETIAGMWLPGEGVVELPDGRTVRGRGLRDANPVILPEHGVYLLGRAPEGVGWSHRWVRWPDFRTPADSDDAIDALREAFDLAAGRRVEDACHGGMGRTGCALAVMAIWAGVAPDEAVTWVRCVYRPRAVETPWQRRWIQRVAR
jgi:protein-tyrosine phosphatase